MKKMKTVLCLLIAFMAVLPGMAQTQPANEIFRSNQEKIMVNELASFNMQYLLDEFTEGSVYFSQRRPVHGKINYNILLDGIQYYDQNNQLLTMLPDQPVDSVVLGNHVLLPYNKTGFIEVFRSGDATLMLYRSIDVHSEALIRGAYGAINRTSSLQQIKTLMHSDVLGRDLTIGNTERQEMEITLTYRQNYFFQTPDGQLIELNNRRTLSRAFPGHSSKINQFLRQNSIDFNSKESLLKLVAFLHTL